MIADLEPELRKAFAEAVDKLRRGVTIRAVVDALADNDIEAAIRALQIEAAAFTSFYRVLENAYVTGGETTASAASRLFSTPGNRVLIRFDVANPRAEREIREYAGAMIREISDDMQAAARRAIAAGYSRGAHPRGIALDLVGRVSRTGRRTGGMLGLTTRQTDAVLHMRERLASGDPSALREILDLKRRDRRFDATILRHIRNGTTPTASEIRAMTGRYSDRLVQLRGEMIARTETGRAVHASKHEAFRQSLEKTGYTEENVTRVWRSARDTHVRDTHSAMDGQKVRGLSEPFISPSGARMMHPLDRSLGAPPEEVIGCRCDEEINIDFAAGLT